jgi:hypothetical protein
VRVLRAQSAGFDAEHSSRQLGTDNAEKVNKIIISFDILNETPIIIHYYLKWKLFLIEPMLVIRLYAVLRGLQLAL